MNAKDRAGTGTVLVTGGTGFLGSWTIAELLERGYHVRTTVRDAGREAELRAGLATLIDSRPSAVATDLHAADLDGRLSVVQADLRADTGWSSAMTDCDFVLHTASPFPSAQPKDPDELIIPARDGTLRVLSAAFDAGVPRVVVTSSSTTIRGSGNRPESRQLTEQDWADADDPRLTPYARSKLLAEQAAWRFSEEHDDRDRLTVICPGTILGPPLGPHRSYSLDVIQRMLNGDMPGVPKLGFGFVDVRDVATMHIDALTAPEAGGERLLAAGPFHWLSEIAAIVRDLGPAADKVPTRTLPNALVRLIARFDPGLRSVVGDLGKRTDYSTEKARRLLGWNPRPIEETVHDTARGLASRVQA